MSNEKWRESKYYKRAIKELGLHSYLTKERASSYESFLKMINAAERNIEVLKLNLDTARYNIKIAEGNMSVIEDSIKMYKDALDSDKVKCDTNAQKIYKTKIQEWGYKKQDNEDAFADAKNDIALIPNEVAELEDFLAFFSGVEYQMKIERHKELQKGIKVKVEYL